MWASMNSFTPVLLSALLGLLAGVSHGVVAHQVNLPISLADQFLQPIQGSSVRQ